MKKIRTRARIGIAVGLMAGVAASALAAEPAPMALDKAAAMFGARVAVAQMSLSPDGKRIAYVGAGDGQTSVLFVGDLATGDLKPIFYTQNNPVDLESCGWAAADRLVCQSRGIDMLYGKKTGYTRLLAIDADGKNMKTLAVPTPTDAQRVSQFDGYVIDYLDRNGQALIARDHVPTETIGTMVGKTDDGIGVDLVDVRTNSGRMVVRPRNNAKIYLTDGKGNVRVMGIDRVDAGGVLLTGEKTYLYRSRNDGSWIPFPLSVTPVAIDPDLNVAYALKSKDGRDALYRISLDGSLKEELVLENPRVDVDGVITLGGKVIGAEYTTDRLVSVYFDPDYRKLSEQLGRVLPNTPLISFQDVSKDGDSLLIRASSDTDEGRLFVFQRASRALHPIMSVRPQIGGQKLATVQSITYRSFDGAEVPAYLTLPPGSSGKNIPAIVMPHGGPEARDVWGFDFLVQFFANRGYAVIQPEFRGSTGFGESWFAGNAFQSWRTAIGDVNAAGRWLVAQGIADQARLAIVGWSYGGYAALQSNVLDPDLFKAVVAVAPVTDLAMFRRESEGFTNENIEKARVGAGPALDEASPDRHAAIFKAPVLLFHGERDINVGFAESQAMNDALHRAGKQSELVRYPGLDHQLQDNKIRVDLLTRADTFLRQALHLPAQ